MRFPHEIKVLPDHCVKIPIADARKTRRLIPGVLSIDIQDR